MIGADEAAGPGMNQGVAAAVVDVFVYVVVLTYCKFVVLGIVDLVFGDRVSLGGFFSMSAVIIVLMVARAGVRRLLQAPLSGAAA